MSTKQIEALKLALEALDKLYLPGELERVNAAITALRAALEQPQQERDPAARNGWVLREVLFDNGEPVGHREPQQEPVALFTWLPEGATHIGRISVRTCSGGSLAMSTHAFKYENGVLRVYITDNDNEYPGWRDAKDVFFHLNFPVLPLYTSPPAAPASQEEIQRLSALVRAQQITIEKLESQRQWVGLTDEQIEQCMKQAYSTVRGRNLELAFARAIEAKLREKNA